MRRALLLGPALVAALVALAACSGDGRVMVGGPGRGAGPVEASPAGVAAAAGRTAALESGRIELRMQGPPGGAGAAMVVHGTFDRGGARLAMALEVDPSVVGDELAGLLGSLELVVDGDALYMKLPIGDGKWVSLPAPDTAPGGPGGLTPMVGIPTPDELLGMLRDVEGVTVDDLGTEDVDGDTWLHLRLTAHVGALLGGLGALDPDALDPDALDPDALDPDALDPEVRARLDAVVDGATAPVDVWFDGDGLVRRVEASVDGAGARVDGVSVSMTITPDPHAAVEVPDPDDVVALDPRLLEALASDGFGR